MLIYHLLITTKSILLYFFTHENMLGGSEMKKWFYYVMTMVVFPLIVFGITSADIIVLANSAPMYIGNFDEIGAIDDFVNATGGYGSDYAAEQICEIENEGGDYGNVMKLGQGGGWNAFNKRYLAEYSNMILAFDMKADTESEKVMVYVRSGQNGDSGYEISVHNDKISIRKDGGNDLKETPLSASRGTGWNAYRIICADTHITVYMNAAKVFSYDEAEPDKSGGFAFGGWRSTIRLDNIKANFFAHSSVFTNDFESEHSLEEFANATGGYGTEYATQQISVIEDEGGEYGKVWRLGQGGGWNAFNKRYLADSTDMNLSFDMKCDNNDEKAMIYIRSGEDGDSGYEISVYNDKISIRKDGGGDLKEAPLSTPRGDDWNSYHISCISNEIILYMNGTRVFEYNEADAEKSGGFAFGGWRCTMRIDNICAHFFSQLEETKAFELNHDAVYLSVGDISTLSTIYPNLKYKLPGEQWVSSDDSIVSVNDNGVITARKSGSATITATAADGESASCTVTINNPCSTFYYVSLDGDDATGDGSIERPFATIERARDVIRPLELPDGGITVYIRDGEYYVNTAITFTPEDSGELGKPIVYSSYPGEKAVIHSGKQITGFKRITEDFPVGLPESARKNIFAADIDVGWRIHDLYVNGERQQAARQFNTNDWSQWDTLERDIITPTVQRSEKGMEITFKESDILKDLPDNGDMEMYLLPVEWWNSLPIVREINVEKKTARLESFNPSIEPNCGDYFGNQLFQHGGHFNLMNAPKFLDEPGEWCVDSVNGKVYWWPKNVNDINHVISPYSTELVRMQGDEEDNNWTNQVEFLELRNLTFMYSDRLAEDKWSDNKMDPKLLVRNAENPHAAIFMQGVKNCTIADSSILFTGTYAITLDHYAQNNRIVRNELGNLGCGGVHLVGYGPGIVDLNHHNTVLANNIYDLGLAPYQHSSAVTVYGSGYNDIKYNNIERTPYTAVMLVGADADSLNPAHFDSRAYSDTYGNIDTQYATRKDDILALDPSITSKFDTNADNGVSAQPYQHSDYNIVEYNMSADYMMDMRDGGCYYAWSTGAHNEYNFNLGERLKNYSGGCYTIYMDNYALYYKLEGNLFWTAHTETRDSSGGINIWRDNIASRTKPEGYDALENKINDTVSSIGGYILTPFHHSYTLAPEINNVIVRESSNQNNTIITLPSLPEDAVKFMLKSTTSKIDAPYIGDIIFTEKELVPNSENEFSSVNGKRFAVYAVDELGGVVAYANATAKTSKRHHFSFKEDFEDKPGEILTDILSKNFGWDYSDDITTTIDMAGGKDGSGIRISNGGIDWWHSQWVSLNISENAASKLIKQGLDEDIASQLAYHGCSNDIKLEFDFKPSSDWKSSNTSVSNSTETYVRLTDANGNAFMGLELYVSDNSTDSSTFNLVALNESKDGTVRYPIYTGIDNVEQWHHISIITRESDNTYKLLVDGKSVPGVPEWIPGADTATANSGSEHSSVKGIGKMIMGNYFSGWWQSAQVDNITLTNIVSDKIEFDKGTVSYTATNDGKEIHIDTIIANTSDEEGKHKIYIAQYSADGVMLDVETKETSILAGNQSEYQFVIPYAANTQSVKMFVWNDDLSPIINHINIQ